MRTAQQLIRHFDIRQTANVYVDPALLDLQGAVEAIPSVTAPLAGTGVISGATESSHDDTSIKTLAS
jgi:hypothetical protein